jgi:heptosyltransferase-2
MVSITLYFINNSLQDFIMDLQLIKYIDRYIGIFLCNLLGFFSSKYQNLGQNPNKILMIKFSGFGNIVLALPTIRAIKKKYPSAEITFLTHTINKAILENETSVDRILTFDIEGNFKTFKNIFSLFSKIKKENFDLIIDFEQFSRFSALVSFFSKAPFRIGFYTKGQGREKLFTHKINYNNNQHTSKTFGDIAKKLKTQIDFNDTKLLISSNDKKKVGFLLHKNNLLKKDILVGIHPGCGINNPKRKWQKEKFAQLADFLIDTYGYKIFFTGTNTENELIKEIQSMMRNNSINFCDSTNIRETAELISRCKCFISNDTGPLHLASAMKIPVVSFFGPNTPLLYGPLGENNLIFYKNLSCSPCTTNFNEKTTKCKHFKCINDISFEEVKSQIKNSNLVK